MTPLRLLAGEEIQLGTADLVVVTGGKFGDFGGGLAQLGLVELDDAAAEGAVDLIDHFADDGEVNVGAKRAVATMEEAYIQRGNHFATSDC